MAGLIAGSPLLARAARSAALHARTDARPASTRCSRAFDFEPVMFANVPQSVYDYTAHGDGGEWNLRRNRQAFDWVDLIPGKAVDPATVDLSSQLLDLKLKYPIVIAPTATQVALHPDGEAGMYRAGALSSNTPMCLSNNSSQSIEQVAKGRAGTAVVAVLSAAGHGREPGAARARAGRRLHRHGHHRRSAGVVLRAQPARSQSRRPHGRRRPRRWTRRRGGAARQGGAGRANDPEALGTATIGRGAAVPGSAGAAARRRRQPAAVRQRIAWARDASGTPGSIWTRCGSSSRCRSSSRASSPHEDARLCVEHGFDGIVVSNHGGRSMDYGPSTLEVLPEIVAAVNGKIPVMIDSGFRRGSDVLKALALGADAVWLGRAARWALGAFGPARRAAAADRHHLQRAGRCGGRDGKTTLASIDASIVKQNWP